MTGVIKLPTIEEIEEQAAAWVWRLDTDDVSSADRKAFEEWLRRDPRHRRAFDELGGVWSALDGLAEAKREEKIATFTRLPDDPAQRSSSGSVLPKVFAVAATVLVAIATWAWLQRGNEAQVLATAVGQQRTVSLADSSTVYLNTNTILETRLDRQQRSVRLVKGEALFDVAHDGQRPFLVHAGNTVVRAVGTEFSVRMRDVDSVEVIVAEGRVEVEAGVKSASVPRAKQALNAGQRLDTKAPAPAAINTESLSRSLAWRQGAIVFDGQPLAEAIAEINRYTDTRFIVNDPRIRAMKIGGRFKAGDVDQFISALEEALPVATRRTADHLVYIDSRQ